MERSEGGMPNLDALSDAASRPTPATNEAPEATCPNRPSNPSPRLRQDDAFIPTESRGKKAEQTCEKHIPVETRSFTA